MTQNEQQNYQNEVWKGVPDYEGIYEVSSHARVRSLDRYVKNQHKSYFKHGVILKQRVREDGRLAVNLNKDSVCTTFLVHRLVAKVFVPNPDNKPQVDHIDTDFTNNHHTNLRWVTDLEHKGCSVQQGVTVRGQYHGNANLSNNEVIDIRRLFKEGYSQNKIADMYQSKQQTISAIVTYKTRKYE